MTAEQPLVAPVPVPDKTFAWHKVLELDGLSDGCATTVTVRRRSLAS